MKKTILSLFLFTIFFLPLTSFSQTGTEFWFAPPEVTSGHGGPNGDQPINLRLATGNTASTVTIDQPALGGAAFAGAGTLVFVIPANSQVTVDLTPYITDLETTPQDAVLNTGLHIVGTASFTAYYELNTTFNPEIFALKGANGLGTEFYTPFNTRWRNGNYTPTPYTSFDIVATENGTTVLIYPLKPLDGGHAALTPYSVTLNRGQTYSGSVTSTVGADNPAGTTIVSDKPIAVSVKDDSVWPEPWGGCKDLMGDQIVPVNIIGQEYIAKKGLLNANIERVFLTAVKNNTQLFIDGIFITNLFAGQTYDHQLDNPFAYITSTEPVYAMHISGFGCEMGAAILPPLNCAGSEQVSFVRSQADPRIFGLSVIVRSGSEGDFQIDGSTTLLQASDFTVVPGTGGVWMGALVTYTNAQISAGVAHQITNSTDVFSLGLINGGSSTGCRFGYFSEFAAQVVTNAGPNQIVCANDSAQLTGSVSGGTTTGQWTSNGSGSFLPNDIDLNAIYVPSPADISGGSVNITLTSTGQCTPVADIMTITLSPAPTINAGTDVSVCTNNANTNLNAIVTVASGGIWSGGAGTYSPNNTSLTTTYTPSAAEITAGTVTLTVTSAGNGTCNPVTDNITITITPSPAVNAGADMSACANNADATLNGSINFAGGGVWSGGAGTFNPSNNSLNATYSPSAGEITAGNVTLTLTSTSNGNCNAESDNVTITYTSAPTVNAGIDQTLCANNAITTLNGSVAGATGGQWTGGLGVFSPSNSTLNASYTPTAAEIASGVINLTLTSTGNGTCNAELDVMTINFTASPTVNAGVNQTVCANNSNVNLVGIVTIATGGQWIGGGGTYSPNNNSLTTTYTPSAAEITAGTVTLTLQTTGNGTCNPETDDIIITITPAPVVNAGADVSACANNPDVTLGGSISFAGGGVWSGGAGTYGASSADLNAVYTPTAAEITAGSVTLTLTSTVNGLCNAEADNVTITYTNAPVTNAGIDQTLCANNAAISLTGTVVGATGGQWSGGLGVFSPSNTSLNSTYTPTAAEIASGIITLTLTTTGNGTCNSESDDMIVNFTASPTVNAGIDQTVCANNSNVNLVGIVTIATGGQWIGGGGTYSPNNNSLTTTYTPSAAEITAGTVTLTLQTTGNGTCNPETDDIIITITPAPVVNAGVGVSACANNPDVTLGGSISFAGGGVWSGGTGTYSASSADLNAVYTPSAGEITAGSVTLTLTSTGNGLCNAEADNVTITYTNAPVTNAGIDQTLCANNAAISLTGTVVGATGGQWSGGLGVFSPSNTSLNSTYTPTAAEIASGIITLTLTTTGNGNCNAEADDMIVNFTASPTSDAGLDATVCANIPNVNLAGVVTVATGGQWIGGGGTFNPNNTDLNAIYTPSSAEITAGTVTLSLQTIGNGNCNPESDDMTITIQPTPIVNAGPNLTSCANNPNVNLAGTVQNATGGIWSGGLGSYNASSTDLNAVYTPSVTEITAGTATLTLTSTGNGLCNPITDNVVITIINAPTANAGSDQSVCGNNSDISLNGSVTGASGGQWTGGLGIFTPSNNALNTVYTPTLGEITSGSLTLTLTTTGVGLCNPESNDMIVNFTTAPTADAGPDLNSCANNSSVNLAGLVTIATGGIWSGGTGSFNTSNTDLNAIYTPSSTEITAGTVTLYLTTTGNGNCNSEIDSMIISIDPLPTVNAGPDQSICVSNLNVNLSGTVSGITNTGLWSTSGSGFFVPNNTTLNATYAASSADSITGTITLTLTSTNNGTCLPITDDMVINILPAGIADAGTDVTVCGNNANISLSGTLSGAATSGTWTTTGTGTFIPNNTDLNATYIPSAGDIALGTATLTLTANSCNAASDDLVITITPEPIVTAGPDQTVCVTNLNISLVGNVSGASTTGLWTTLGTGTFIPNATDPNATYNASSADSIAQTVTIIFSATNIGNCSAVSDTMIINMFELGTANTGADQVLCANNGDAVLAGIIGGGATQGVWSTSGTGGFSPSNTDVNATYLPSPGDIIVGTVSLLLTATNSCNAASDNLTITYTPAPIVDAGLDQTMCGTNPVILLSGSVSGATAGIWSTSGSGTFSPNTSDLNASYTASPTDVAAGSITIYLTSVGNGNCNAEVDSMTLDISTGVVVNAGTDQTVCSTAPFTIILGSVTNGSTTGIWSTLGTGTFSPSATVLITEYHFSSADSLAGSVTLFLTSTNNGSCLADADTMTITLGNSAYANAGADQIVCANNMTIVLSGIVSGGASLGQWSTTGSGGFTPNNTALNAIYIPSSADSLNGSVNIILSTTDHGSCLVGTDTMSIIIDYVPVVLAGNNIQACANEDSIPLSGVINFATGGTWTTSGSGTFFPNNTTLQATYLPSVLDMSTGSLTLTLTSLTNGLCPANQDDLTVTFINPLTVNFGYIETCVGNPMNFYDSTIVLSGTILNWDWDFGDGDTSIAQNPTHIYTSSGAKDITLTVQSSLGCSSSLVQSIILNDAPIAGFTFSSGEHLINESVTFIDQSSGASDWLWDFGDASDSSVASNPQHTYLDEGIYIVTQTVSDNFGCTDETSLEIIIEDLKVFPPVLPSGFSPNGDGENDVLIVRGGPFKAVHLVVYNNWGNLIFESEDAEIGWDGTWKGTDQFAGDYVFTVKATTIDDKEYVKHGSVSIIR